MTRDDLTELFEKHDDLYLKDEGIDGPADLAAFNILNKLVPSKKNVVSDAAHDEFWLSTPPEDLAAVASEEDIIFLIRCGIRLDDETDSLAMFA